MQALAGGQSQQQNLLRDIVCKFIVDNGKNNILVHKAWEESFKEHIKRLMDNGTLIGLIYDNRLVGTLGYAFIDDLKRINKLRWTLPENIKDGRILYVSHAVMVQPASVLIAKAYLEEIETRKKVDEIMWGNFKKGKNFKKKILRRKP